MKTLLFGRGSAPEHRRPVVCSDCGAEIVSGLAGEPEYGCCDACRRIRGTGAMKRTNSKRGFGPRDRRI